MELTLLRKCMDKNIIFAGTPDFAAIHLQALIDANLKPKVVYTQPDRPCGRGHKLTPSPVKTLAQKYGIEVRTPLNFKDDADIQNFIALKSDLFIVVAYGIILPEAIINAPAYGCINVHGSLLPKYRGAAPIQRALLNGDRQTGVTIMKIAKALDAGDIYVKATLDITDNDTSLSLFEKLAALGAQTLVESVPKILNGCLKTEAQDESLATYAQKLSKEESALDFTLTADKLCLKIRGLNPWPIATLKHNNVTYKVFDAKPYVKYGNCGEILECNRDGIIIGCQNGSLCITQIQEPGHKRVNAADLARSRPDLFAIGSICD